MMKQRCCNPNNKDYEHYGKKGITICEEWLNPKKTSVSGTHICNVTEGFLSFQKWALSHGFEEGLTLDRIDVNGGYCPENCRWVSWKTQQNNKGNNHWITLNGETKTMKQWCDILGKKYTTVRARINRSHWSVEKAFDIN